MPSTLPASAFHVPTRNAIALENAGRIAVRTPGEERIVAIHGPAGAGKSHAAARIVVQHAAVFLRLNSVDTARTIAVNVCNELQLCPKRTTADNVAQVIRELRLRPRLVVLDEFGFIVGARALHMIRDIHDATSEAKFLVLGDDRLRSRLEQHSDRAFFSRVVHWQATVPVGIEDLAKLATVYVPGIMLTEELLGLLIQECEGNCRLAVIALRRIADIARRDTLARVDVKIWRDRHGPLPEIGLRVVR